MLEIIYRVRFVEKITYLLQDQLQVVRCLSGILHYTSTQLLTQKRGNLRSSAKIHFQDEP